jgi:hypothetical protein
MRRRNEIIVNETTLKEREREKEEEEDEETAKEETSA